MITQLTESISAVKVPLPITAKIAKEHLGVQWIETPAKYGCDKIPLPPGQWEIVGIASEISEEVAKTIVSELMFGSIIGRTRYKNYMPDKKQSPTYDCCYTAIESLYSLLESKGCDKTDLIIRKIK